MFAVQIHLKRFLLSNWACTIWINMDNTYNIYAYHFYLFFRCLKYIYICIYLGLCWYIWIYLYTHVLDTLYVYIYLFILSPPIYVATPTTATYRVCIGVHPDHLTIEGMLRWCREFPPFVDRRFFHGHPPQGWNGADNLGWPKGKIPILIFEQQIIKNHQKHCFFASC